MDDPLQEKVKNATSLQELEDLFAGAHIYKGSPPRHSLKPAVQTWKATAKH